MTAFLRDLERAGILADFAKLGLVIEHRRVGGKDVIYVRQRESRDAKSRLAGRPNAGKGNRHAGD